MKKLKIVINLTLHFPFFIVNHFFNSEQSIHILDMFSCEINPIFRIGIVYD